MIGTIYTNNIFIYEIKEFLKEWKKGRVCDVSFTLLGEVEEEPIAFTLSYDEDSDADIQIELNLEQAKFLKTTLSACIKRTERYQKLHKDE